MATIAKAVIGSVSFNLNQPVQVGIAFFDAQGNTVDIQTFPLPVAAYGTRAAVLNAIQTQVIAYAAEFGVTLTSTDVLSVY